MIAQTFGRRRAAESVAFAHCEAFSLAVVHAPPRPSPNSAQLFAVYLAAWAANERGIELEAIETSSKNAVKCCDPLVWSGKLGTRGKPARLDGGGGTYSCPEDALLASWLIYWATPVRLVPPSEINATDLENQLVRRRAI